MIIVDLYTYIENNESISSAYADASCVCVCVCGEVLLAVQVDLLHFSIAAEIESIRVWFVLGSRLWLDIATCENDLYLCSLTCCVL